MILHERNYKSQPVNKKMITEETIITLCQYGVKPSVNQSGIITPKTLQGKGPQILSNVCKVYAGALFPFEL